jgi:Mg2+/citrate symporter
MTHSFGRGSKRAAETMLPELSSHRQTKLTSERNFGLAVGAVLALVGLWPLIHGGSPRLWLIAIAAVLALAAIVYPKVLAIPNRLWFALGNLLGAIVSPIVAAILFYGVLTPVGLVLRISGRDALRLRAADAKRTYWIERRDPPRSMRNQF